MADEKAIALLEKDISDSVMARITDMVGKSELALPEGYNAGTALRSALLTIKETKDKNGKTALEVCTKASVANAFLNMCIQGLDPTKRQCYFIVYGNQLQLFRSYFGTQSALRRAVPAVHKIVADLAHEGDEYEWGTNQFGERYIERITTDPLANIDKPVRFGFCNIYDKDGNLLGSTVMTWSQIQTSWAKTRSGGATQREFPEEMAKRTLINRACKHILNSSLDSNAAVVAAFNQTSDSEYEVVDEDKGKAEGKSAPKSFKERYGIGKVEEPKADAEPPKPQKAEEPKGPEDFEDTPLTDDDDIPFPESDEGQREMF
jgi:recombination protein RecT